LHDRCRKSSGDPRLIDAVFAKEKVDDLFQVSGMERLVDDLRLEELPFREVSVECFVALLKRGHDLVVPLAPELRAVVTEAMPSKLPSARLIVNSNGHTPTRQTVLSKLHALQDRLGLPSRSFHSLRHFFCTTLIRNGASAEAVRVLAGHHDLTVTQRYVHATAADLETAMARLNVN
jgi:site-specific recombinase XerD